MNFSFRLTYDDPNPEESSEAEVSSSEYFETQTEVEEKVPLDTTQTEVEETVPLDTTQTEADDSYSELIQITDEVQEDAGMVYASGEELESVYALLQSSDTFHYWGLLNKYGYSVVKESISPVYAIDLEEFNQEKKIILRPYNYYLNKYKNKWGTLHPNRDNRYWGKLYVGKVVDKTGNYRGVLTFRVEEGVAIEHNMSICHDNVVLDEFFASQSYADYAESIRQQLGAETVIPPSDVRLVNLYEAHARRFFYICNDDYQVLIPTGAGSWNGECANLYYGEPISMTKLTAFAEDYAVDKERRRRAKEEWEKEHPGELFYYYPPSDGMMSMDNLLAEGFVRGGEDINNIADIASYLNIDYSKNWDSSATLGADLKPIKENSKMFLPFLFAGIGVLLVSGAVVFFVLYKKRKRMQNVET